MVQRIDGGATFRGNGSSSVSKVPPKLTLPAESGTITAELVEEPMVVESSKLCGRERLKRQ
jgi:hypothetical protein